MRLIATYHPGHRAIPLALAMVVGLPLLGGIAWLLADAAVSAGWVAEQDHGIALTVAAVPLVVGAILVLMYVRHRASRPGRGAIVELGAGTIQVTRQHTGKVLLRGALVDVEVGFVTLLAPRAGEGSGRSGVGVVLSTGGQRLTIGALGPLEWTGRRPTRFDVNWLVTPDEFVALARDLGVADQLVASEG